MLHSLKTQNKRPDVGPREPAATINVRLAQASPLELDRINDVVTAALYSWELPDRVKRISLPIYRYHANDFEHMQFLVADIGGPGITGLVALEEVDVPEWPDSRKMLLLHGLYVYPCQHRQGTGTRLVEAAEAVAKGKAIGHLLVRAQAEAQPFFLKCGFSKLPVVDDSRDYAHRYWKPI